MTIESSEETSAGKAPVSPAWRVAGSVGFALFIGVLGSGLWELIFRPGVYRFGDLLQGSWSALDDAVFTNAALDPQALPSLMILLFVLFLPILVVWTKLWSGLGGPSWFAIKQWRVSRGSVVKGGTILLCIFYSAMYFLTYNESILVWRVFHRNLRIAAPILTQEEERSFISEFAKMRRRADFHAIRMKLDDVVSQKQVEKLDWGSFAER